MSVWTRLFLAGLFFGFLCFGYGWEFFESVCCQLWGGFGLSFLRWVLFGYRDEGAAEGPQEDEGEEEKDDDCAGAHFTSHRFWKRDLRGEGLSHL